MAVDILEIIRLCYAVKHNIPIQISLGQWPWPLVNQTDTNETNDERVIFYQPDTTKAPYSLKTCPMILDHFCSSCKTQMMLYNHLGQCFCVKRVIIEKNKGEEKGIVFLHNKYGY